jgi:glycosyltransferase involved in cell wall biosynthesis
MHVAIVNNSVIPAVKYGGIERVIWWLGKELVRKGHKVTYLVNPGSGCDFADVIFIDKRRYHKQLPDSVDVIHYHSTGDFETKKPFLYTLHGNIYTLNSKFHINTVGISADHAKRMNASAYVYNGLDFDEYGKPELANERKFFHFLGDAAWKVKNVKGAIKIAKAANETLAVLGGTRLSMDHGIKINFSKTAKFYGKVGGEYKNHLLNQSKGLLFPVLWQEPFGLAITESLYFGCPVFGTPFGSLPELVKHDLGFLSDSYSALSNAIKNVGAFNRKHCHDYVVDNFSASKMADSYLKMYEKVLNGETLNETEPVVTEDFSKLSELKP